MFISIHIFFNSCIPCRMQSISPSTNRFFTISIHALRVECNEFGSDVYALSDISIHALRVECNEGEPLPEMATVQFQFMHSEWSATRNLQFLTFTLIFQFMHSEWSATAKYSIHFSIYTIFCICYILLYFLHNHIY